MCRLLLGNEEYISGSFSNKKAAKLEVAGRALRLTSFYVFPVSTVYLVKMKIVCFLLLFFLPVSLGERLDAA